MREGGELSEMLQIFEDWSSETVAIKSMSDGLNAQLQTSALMSRFTANTYEVIRNLNSLCQDDGMCSQKLGSNYHL